MSTAVAAEIEGYAPPERRPGTFVRFLLLLAAVASSAVVLTVGFPAGAPDRLPVLLLALALAVDAAFRPSRAVRDFCFLFPLSGLAASVVGTADPVAWPVLLFGGLAVGWTFRFLYDFESVGDPSPLDVPLRALVAVWALGTVVAVVRARTLWAISHDLSGRAVNGLGLSDSAAIRESVLTFAILLAGAAFFFLLRRAGEFARVECLKAVLLGIGLSAAAAILQAMGLFPAETRPFWRLTGRLSGGATDPNALGLLCGLAVVFLLGVLVGTGGPSRRVIGALLPLPVGLALSGSRSGFLVAVVGSAAIVAFASFERRLRAVVALGVFLFALAIALLPRESPGGVGGRLGQLFRSALSIEDRTSSRPILWRAATNLFAESPVEGGGVGSFAWRLPDLLPASAAPLPMRDNPGSAYLQALAETGVLGFAAVLLFVVLLAGHAFRRTRDPASTGAGAAVLAFLLALTVGSHWLAPEVSLLFFLLAAEVVASGERGPRWTARASAALVVVFTAAAVLALARTATPAETFRYSRFIGFHRLESGPGGPFRWTRKRFAVQVRSDAPEQISLANYSPEGRAVALSVTGDNRVLYRRSVRPGEAIRLALWSGGRARAFVFELDRAFVPKRLTGSEDRRELGLLAVFAEDRR